MLYPTSRPGSGQTSHMSLGAGVGGSIVIHQKNTFFISLYFMIVFRLIVLPTKRMNEALTLVGICNGYGLSLSCDRTVVEFS